VPDLETRTTLPSPAVVGIDISTRAIDLVRLAENDDVADWLSIPLVGDNAWDRIRSIPQRMPHGSWWDNIYLAAIEKPFGHGRDGTIRLAQGAVIACIPSQLELWEVAPATWKSALGVPIRDKPGWDRFAPSLRDLTWPQDARDALAVALYARDINAAGIAAALAAG
jgi:hypothetical protein